MRVAGEVVSQEEYAAPDTSPVRLAVTEAIHAMGCLGWKPVDGTDKTYHVCRSVAGNVAAALFHKGLLAEVGGAQLNAADPTQINLDDCSGEGDECYTHGDACRALSEGFTTDDPRTYVERTNWPESTS